MGGRTLNAGVSVYDPAGVLVTLNKGDEAPEWAEFGEHLFDAAEADTADDSDDNGDGDKALDKLTVAELRAYAKDEEIDLGGATSKADIRAAIDAAEADTADDSDEDSDQS